MLWRRTRVRGWKVRRSHARNRAKLHGDGILQEEPAQIIQGPAEQALFDDAKIKFDKLQRVKPNASRQESKEIYFLGQGYEESQDPIAVDIRNKLKKFENARTQEESDAFMNDFMKEGQTII